MVPEPGRRGVVLPEPGVATVLSGGASGQFWHLWAHNTMAEASATAQRRWELENNVQADDEVEGFFSYNHAEQQAVQQQKPWSKDPHLYKQYASVVCL